MAFDSKVELLFTLLFCELVVLVVVVVLVVGVVGSVVVVVESKGELFSVVLLVEGICVEVWASKVRTTNVSIFILVNVISFEQVKNTITLSF